VSVSLRRALLFGAAGAVLALAAAGAVAAEPGSALEHFLDGLKTLRADFTQSVTDAQGQSTEHGSGTLLVQRPGKFRWDYLPQTVATGADVSPAAPPREPASGQLLIADGKNLWFYDRELAQVTVKPLADALSSTPMMLLSGPSSALQANFELSDGGAHDGLQWTEVAPRSGSGDFKSAELGFAHDQLARMIVHDKLGQTVRLEFTHAQRNPALDAAAFAFKPPPDVDVIGTPQS
jgi:outer membrane lipoprotein carrier protein